MRPSRAPVPEEFTRNFVDTHTNEESKIPYYRFWRSGEPFKSMHRNNPWLRPPDYSKPLECPYYDAGRGAEGGGWLGPNNGGERAAYWDTTVARKHGYWKNFDMPTGTKDIRRLRRDLLEYGYCIVEDAMSPEQLQFMRGRLDEQARAEREMGLADMSPFFHIM